MTTELMTAVTGEKVKQVSGTVTDNVLEYLTESYGFGDGCLCEINVYELAHKCKEWAKNKGYTLMSGYDDGNVFLVECSNRLLPLFYADSEPEAIFKACQWILENKDKNG